ncbi:hypothetical protein FT986_06210 [Mesonia sp. K4-1]|nr:hypothetical protein FT986_06210 [Mesonia sp. K4-1]
MTEGVAKDIILEYAVEHFGEPITVHKIHKELFKHNSLEEIKFLFEKMSNKVDKVAEIEISEYNSVITANEITKKFLEQGGFTETEKKAIELKKRELHKDEVEFEKSIIDLRLKKWQVKTFWPIFIFAIIGSGFGVYNFINSLTPSKNTEKLELRIEKMESELKKLQTSISDKKNLDSLQSTKVLTDKKTIE